MPPFHVMKERFSESPVLIMVVQMAKLALLVFQQGKLKISSVKSVLVRRSGNGEFI